MNAKDHYDHHLAAVYAWMLGDFDSASEKEKQLFAAYNILPQSTAIAIDLGAGNGIQSLALASLGFKVFAVDFSKGLLEELDSRKNGFDIKTCLQDISSFLEDTSLKAEVITCMGDTLTHLESRQEVVKMVQRITDRLVKGGKVIVSYRDLSKERSGIDRFIHVKSDDKRSMTCFLEYFPEFVIVHDVLTEKSGDTWTQMVSSYSKLRLPVAELARIITNAGLRISAQREERGLSYIIADKH